MDFQKTLKKRLCFNIAYLLFGIALIVTASVTKSENDFFYGFGFSLTAIGILQSARNFHLIRNQQDRKHREVAEKDERNVMLALKARSMAFILYIIGAGVAVIVLSLAAQHQVAQIVAWSVCILTALYWVSYLYLKNKY